MITHVGRLLVAATFAIATELAAFAQSAPTRMIDANSATIDTLLQTAGPAWATDKSQHFVVHMERSAAVSTRPAMSAMIDSLEAAWDGAVALLATPVSDQSRAHVFVTASRTRFAGLIKPDNKGLYIALRSGHEVILIVHNDSVRAYTRHEVMHDVSYRAWGTRSGKNTWLAEALATFADGKCQGAPFIAVARDVLASKPALNVNGLRSDFGGMSSESRATAYVLGASLVDFLWDTRGREGVRRIWTGLDTLVDPTPLPGVGGNVTVAWRAHVARKAGTMPGISPQSLERSGCG